MALQSYIYIIDFETVRGGATVQVRIDIDDTQVDVGNHEQMFLIGANYFHKNINEGKLVNIAYAKAEALLENEISLYDEICEFVLSKRKQYIVSQNPNATYLMGPKNPAVLRATDLARKI